MHDSSELLVLLLLALKCCFKLADFFTHLTEHSLLVALEHLDLFAKFLSSDDGFFFQVGLPLDLPLGLVHLLGLDPVYRSNGFLGLCVLLHDTFHFLVSMFEGVDDLVDIYTLFEPHLECHALQVVQSVNLRMLELEQFVFLDLL